MGNFGEFTHKYQVSKTLRFELIPQGKTLENVTRYGIVDDDKLRSENYKKLKPVIDRIYTFFIEETLKNVSIDWQPLYEAIIAYRKDQSTSNDARLKEEQEACRKAIAGWFEGKVPDKGNKELKEFNKTQSKLFKELFGKDMNVIKDVIFEGRILDQVQQAVDYIKIQMNHFSKDTVQRHKSG